MDLQNEVTSISAKALGLGTYLLILRAMNPYTCGIALGAIGLASGALSIFTITQSYDDFTNYNLMIICVGACIASVSVNVLIQATGKRLEDLAKYYMATSANPQEEINKSAIVYAVASGTLTLGMLSMLIVSAYYPKALPSPELSLAISWLALCRGLQGLNLKPATDLLLGALSCPARLFSRILPGDHDNTHSILGR